MVGWRREGSELSCDCTSQLILSFVIILNKCEFDFLFLLIDEMHL